MEGVMGFLCYVAILALVVVGLAHAVTAVFRLKELGAILAGVLIGIAVPVAAGLGLIEIGARHPGSAIRHSATAAVMVLVVHLSMAAVGALIGGASGLVAARAERAKHPER